MKPQIVSFHCVLTDPMGKVISSSFNQDVITQDHQGADFLKGLAEGLQNLKKGEKRRICLSAEQAYGLYDPDLVLEVPRKELVGGGKLGCGQQIESRGRNGNRKMFRVTRILTDMVTLDANHPLAGQDLVFEIEATEAREATPEELAELAAEGAGPFLH